MNLPRKPESPRSPVENEGGNAQSSTEAIELGSDHRRGITSTLVYLDETLCHVRRLLRNPESPSVLYIEQDNLTGPQRTEALREIELLHGVLEELRRKLDLRPATRDVGARISAECMSLWDSVIELQGKHLKRYGEPPENLVRYLNPKTDEIIRHLERIVHVLGVFRSSRL